MWFLKTAARKNIDKKLSPQYHVHIFYATSNLKIKIENLRKQNEKQSRKFEKATWK